MKMRPDTAGAVGIGIILAAAFLYVLWLNRLSTSPDDKTGQEETMVSDTGMDTTGLADISRDTPADSVPKRTVGQRKRAPKIGAQVLSAPDTTEFLFDSQKIKPEKTMTDPCAGDTIIPWVFPDPSGGLFRAAVNVVLQTTKPCSVAWKFDDGPAWRHYRNGDTLNLTHSAVIMFKAWDRCGNRMAARDESYEIRVSDSARQLCPSDMELISIGASRFCIDRYEWPNRRGELPDAFISLYAAMDSCLSRERRLCSSEEWLLACAGPWGRRYPYGNRYEPRACVTRDTTVRVSGSHPECRGYFGVHDMSGNLLEWTSTRSSVNRRFYNVMGGFWESASRSRCRDIRHSYYPQNRHNPVGFRCCRNTREQ